MIRHSKNVRRPTEQHRLNTAVNTTACSHRTLTDYEIDVRQVHTEFIMNCTNDFRKRTSSRFLSYSLIRVRVRSPREQNTVQTQKLVLETTRWRDYSRNCSKNTRFVKKWTRKVKCSLLRHA